MGQMNAVGWALCETASEGTDGLWDLLNEFSERTGGHGPAVHAMPLYSGAPRYCVHPDGEPSFPEFRSDDLREALVNAVFWKAAQMDEGDMWRRE